MPRSGTTGVGSALASAPGAAHLYEPLNPESGLRSVPHYFVTPSAADDVSGGPATADLLQEVWRVGLRTRTGIWPHDPRWKKLVKRVSGSTSRASAVRIRLDRRIDTVIWKDPFAVFLVPLLAHSYDLPCVITVRPPEAAAASFKRLGWSFDLPAIVERLQLITPEAPYLQDLPDPSSLADSTMMGAAIWRLVYGYLDHTLGGTLDGTSDSDPAGPAPKVWWANSRHLLSDPVATYRRLFTDLGLPLTPQAITHIEETYRDEGSRVPGTGVTHDASRNVALSNSYFADVLTDSEVARVRALTSQVREALELRIGRLA